MARLRLKYVKAEHRRGRMYYYFRRRGFARVSLPGVPGSTEFMAAYQAALEGAPVKIGAARTAPGTINALVVSYFSSPAFTQTLSASTQATYRNIIERFRRAHGHKRVATLQRKHVIEMRDKIGATAPAAANNMLRMLRTLMQHAVEREWRPDDPTLGVKPIKYATGGHRTWSEEDIAAFEARHPIGTKAHLALTLMLYTGARRGDVVTFGPQHITDGKLTYTQEKNRKRKPVTLTIPVDPLVAAAIAATPTVGVRTFLVTHYGKPFTKAGFGNWMRDRCNEAGLPECSSHGLRKAISRRLADAGCSPHQIMAVTGHRTLKEVERYTREANQKQLAETAMKSDATETGTSA